MSVVYSPIPNAKKIKEALKSALNSLYRHEHEKIVLGGKENYLNAKLRDFLQPFFPGWEVRCEQRKDGDRFKENSSGKVVRPDVIIHNPGKNGPNVAIVEAKGYWNRTNREIDREKLKDYVKTQHYINAYQVEYARDEPILYVIAE